MRYTPKKRKAMIVASVVAGLVVGYLVGPFRSATMFFSTAPSPTESCTGPNTTLTGRTTSQYELNRVADGTTFDLTNWYSNAVGDTTSGAFTVGATNGPAATCVTGGVVNGHLPLEWDWDMAHDYGGFGYRTYVGAGTARLSGARVHNVEDGWKPREQPEWTNKASFEMSGVYMTGIRDDCIENDNFMPGEVSDSLFDGVFTFLSEQNQTGTIPDTMGPHEDPYIRITNVNVRLYGTNSDGSPGRWFKWQPRGAIPHKLIIRDSVFALTAGKPRSGWDILTFPTGTTFEGTNYVLWLGAPGGYKGVIPSGVTFLERQAAKDKWNDVRNAWLTAHGYETRAADDLNPMDEPVVAPRCGWPCDSRP